MTIPFVNHPLHVDTTSRDTQPCKHPPEHVDVGSARKKPACHSCGARLCQYCKVVAVLKGCNTCPSCADERGP